MFYIVVFYMYTSFDEIIIVQVDHNPLFSRKAEFNNGQAGHPYVGSHYLLF